MCGRFTDMYTWDEIYAYYEMIDELAGEPVDAWLKLYERPDGVKQAMEDYLAWVTDLLPRNGCAKFARFG